MVSFITLYCGVPNSILQTSQQTSAVQWTDHYHPVGNMCLKWKPEHSTYLGVLSCCSMAHNRFINAHRPPRPFSALPKRAQVHFAEHYFVRGWSCITRTLPPQPLNNPKMVPKMGDSWSLHCSALKLLDRALECGGANAKRLRRGSQWICH